MKVIDLLVRIVNGKKPPKHIKCGGLNLYWNDENYTYDIREKGTLYAPFYIFNYSELNDVVEIIEEDENINKIDFKILNTQKEKNRVMKDTINKLIDEINKMKEGK